MRMPTYLSPSQLSLWASNREEYYLRHLAETRAPKIAQTNYMSIGSSFDAYVKSALYEALYGKGHNPQFEFMTIFEQQVEEHNRDWALTNGQYVFECYKKYGAYDELLAMVAQSKSDPRFEFTATGTIEGVPLLGKPDMQFIHQSGCNIILDWKISGYCSKSPTSPAKNYKLARDCWGEDVAKPTRGGGGAHKEYKPMMWKGIEIHSGWLEDANMDWGNQLAIYSWLLGEPVGSQEVIVCIDQICGKPIGLEKPLLRIANHRARISKVHQMNLMQQLQDCWNAITRGHIFDSLTLMENAEYCEMMEKQAILSNSEDPIQKYLNNLERRV